MKILTFEFGLIKKSEWHDQYNSTRWEEVEDAYFCTEECTEEFETLVDYQYNEYYKCWEPLEYAGIETYKQLRVFLLRELQKEDRTANNISWVEFWIEIFRIKDNEKN